MTVCQVKDCKRKADMTLWRGKFGHAVCNTHGALYNRPENRQVFIVWKSGRKLVGNKPKEIFDF